MSKHLLATTAVAIAGAMALSQSAVAMDAAKPSLKIGGVVEQGIGFNENSGDVVYNSDNEIQFTASVKLDNGLSVTGRVELDGEADGGGIIDEGFVKVSGGFGEIQLGGADGAMYEKTGVYLGTWSTNTGLLNPDFDHSGYVYDGSTPGRLSGVATVPRVSNDNRMIAYYTPRVSGLQIGVSYAGTGSGGTDGLETSATYVGNFGDASVGVALGYGMLNTDGTAGQVENHEVTMVGVKVGLGGLTLGVSYVNDINMAIGDGDDTDRFDLGVRYGMGPMTFALGLMTVENGAGAEATASKLSLSRSLGPGVTWSGDLILGDYSAGANEADGMGFHTGIAIKF